MRKKFCSILMAAMLLAFAAVAGEKVVPEGLPGAVIGYFSAKNPQKALTTLDEYIANVTGGTSVDYTPNLVPIMAFMLMPEPAAKADLEQECHVVLLAGDDNQTRLVIMPSVADYAKYIAAVKDGSDVLQDEDGITLIAAQQNMQFAIADAGEGLAIIANNAKDVQTMRDLLRTWRPTAPADALLSFVFAEIAAIDRDKLVDDIAAEIRKSIADSAGDIVMRADELGLDQSTAEAGLKLLSQSVDLARHALNSIDSGRLDIMTDGEEFSAALLLFGKEGSQLAALAANAEQRGNQLPAVARAIDSSAGLYSQTNSLLDLLPDSGKLAEQVVSTIFEQLMPTAAAQAVAGQRGRCLQPSLARLFPAAMPAISSSPMPRRKTAKRFCKPVSTE